MNAESWMPETSLTSFHIWPQFSSASALSLHAQLSGVCSSFSSIDL